MLIVQTWHLLRWRDGGVFCVILSEAYEFVVERHAMRHRSKDIPNNNIDRTVERSLDKYVFNRFTEL